MRSFPHSWLVTGFVTWRVPHVEQELLTFLKHMSSPLFIFLGGIKILLFVLPYYASLLKFPVVMSVKISAYKRCLACLYLQLFVGRLMFYLRYLCTLCIVVSNTFCVVFFVLLVFVLCTQCFQFLWFVLSWLPLQFSVTFISSNYRGFSWTSSHHLIFNFILCKYHLNMKHFSVQY